METHTDGQATMRTLDEYIASWKERGWDPWRIVESSKRINVGLIEENKHLRKENEELRQQAQERQ